MAMREGLSLDNSISCQRIVAESDSLETVEACTGKARWWNDPSAIFFDCMAMVSSIGNVTFKYCQREANHVAHEIARVYFHNRVLVIGSMNPLILFYINL
jgi:hypothetical protein